MLAPSGFRYFLLGFKLIQTKGVKRYVIIPFIINLLLFASAFAYLLTQVDPYINSIIANLPGWLSWLESAVAYVVWPFAVVSMLLLSAFLFGTLANWIAAPFNGLLAARIEESLTNQPSPNESFFDTLKDVPRLFGRELIKLKYYLPRAAVFLLAFFFMPVIGQVLWFLFCAWMMAVQYCDYPFDNHKISFEDMRHQLLTRKAENFGFGATVMLFSMIPIINFLVMPVAICGATAIWVDHHKNWVYWGQQRLYRNGADDGFNVAVSRILATVVWYSAQITRLRPVFLAW